MPTIVLIRQVVGGKRIGSGSKSREKVVIVENVTLQGVSDALGNASKELFGKAFVKAGFPLDPIASPGSV